MTYTDHVTYMGCVTYRVYATYGGHVTQMGKGEGNSVIKVHIDGGHLGQGSIFAHH